MSRRHLTKSDDLIDRVSVNGHGKSLSEQTGVFHVFTGRFCRRSCVEQVGSITAGGVRVTDPWVIAVDVQTFSWVDRHIIDDVFYLPEVTTLVEMENCTLTKCLNSSTRNCVNSIANELRWDVDDVDLVGLESSYFYLSIRDSQNLYKLDARRLPVVVKVDS